MFYHDWEIHKQWMPLMSPYMLKWLPFRLPHHMYIGLSIIAIQWFMLMRKVYNELET